MKHFALHRILAALAAVACAFSLAACGGHDSRSSGGSSSSSTDNSSGSSPTATAPDFDASGAWATLMDGEKLGTSTFSMGTDGHLSGSLKTDSGETGTISGHLSGLDAEYTVTFQHRTFLIAVDFTSAHTSGTGTLVDADGHVHTLKLER